MFPPYKSTAQTKPLVIHTTTKGDKLSSLVTEGVEKTGDSKDTFQTIFGPSVTDKQYT